MAVRYVRLNAVADLNAPMIRGTGNIAIVGVSTAGTANTPVQVGSPSDAPGLFGPPAGSPLTAAIQLAFGQTPGPSQVWGVPGSGDFTAALTAVEALDVQFVTVANQGLDAMPGGGGAASAARTAVTNLANHVVNVSQYGSDGKERMGVAMLAKGLADITGSNVLSGTLANERMVYVAHKSDQDVAAAVTGAIAGWPPNTSMLLKQVSVDNTPFTYTEIDAINGTEVFTSGPAGKGVNWLVHPALIPGSGVYLGEGYTGNPAGKKYIDIVRTIDDISFKLKARLIRYIGVAQISRSGLRALVLQMEAELDPQVAAGVINSYSIVVPILNLLDLPPASLSDQQLQAIHDAEAQRVIQVLITVEYAAAIHRLAITLKFE